jgi:3-hydroxyisobutyrate dehydrogenase-like beta-hydroxyacid dehydrogenase
MSSAPTPASKHRIAYLGLGAMGAPMAANLLKHGYEVHVWNRTPEKAAPLQAQGARVLSSLAALRDLEIEYAFTNVSDSPALLAVVDGKDGLAHVLRPGATVIDNSSVSPEVAREVTTLLAARKIAFLDAPVTGGTTGAQAGTLTIMVGGDREIAHRADSLLRAIGSAIFYVGPAGSGQACKLCHQVAAACAMLGLCEGLALAAKAELPLRTVLGVLGAGSAGSPLTRTQGAKILAGDHTPGFRVDLMRKDLRTAHTFAETLSLPLPGSEVVAAMLASLSSAGAGDCGWQALIREFEARGAFRLPPQT